MYEFDKYAPPPNPRALLQPRDPYRHCGDVAAASLLFWGEHCIECAEPACFQTCDLYRARPDGRCRRFTWGIARNRAFPSARGYGAEIAFKKWGKLESRGNTAMLPRGRLLALERVFGWSAPLLNGVGAVASRVSGDARWRGATVRVMDRVLRRMHRRSRASILPDAFLLEIYNPGDVAVRLQISMSIARKELRQTLGPAAVLPMFRKEVELPPGYSRHEIARREFGGVTEAGLPFDIALIPEGDTEPTLIFLTADFVKYPARSSTAIQQQDQLPGVKCVIWDLDNTLWRGTLLEEDVVHPEAMPIELIRRLDERGILCSVASKNDYAQALAKLAEFGIADYMVFPQIGWQPKSESIKTIAEKLNIGLDTFVFVDDNPFELDEVRRALPMVTCIDARDIGTLADNPRLVGSTTAEAKRRRLMYREAMHRDEEEQKFSGNFFEFLRSCEMRLSIKKYNQAHFARVAELVQRTNQLNFSGHKYKREEVDPILSDPKLEKWVLECSDKFGSYGVVGFGLASRAGDQVGVQDFMLSCRVQGRFVEQAFFNALVANDPAKRWLSVNFHATSKNTPAQQVLAAIGFEAAEGVAGMRLDLSQRDISCDFILVDSDVGEVETEEPRELNVSAA